MARSTWVAYAFELGKLLKCHLKGKASRKLANGQNIEDFEKRKWPKGFICSCTGVKYHNIQTFIGICSRSQVSVYRTIGPLVWCFGHVSTLYYMSRIVRKRDYCLCENKGADQLRSNCEADQRLCFRYSDSAIPLLLKSEISSF